MILRSIVIGALIVAAIVLQTVVLARITVFGFRPDLVLVLVLAVAIRDGPLAGARVGAVAGLGMDLLITSAPVGLSVLIYAVVGHLAGVARPYLAPGSVSAPVLLAFVTGIGATAAYGALAAALSDVVVTGSLLVQAALVVGLVNALLSPLVFGVVDRVVERFPLRGAAAE